MKILILHKIPYYKINYHKGINHEVHDVYYFGYKSSLENIPTTLKCKKTIRAEKTILIEEVINWIKNEELIFDLVISLSEYELLDAAKIRMILDISGPKIKDVEKVRNKLIMKEYVSKKNIIVPKNISLKSYITKKEIEFTNKVVLKPVDGASSEDIHIFDNLIELDKFIEQYLKTENYNNYELEEFIEGDVIHFDGLVKDKELLIVIGSKYINNCFSYAMEGKPLGSYQIDILESEKIWVEEVLNAMSLKNGSFHLEAFKTQEDLVFLEIGNRVGGADVVDTFELASGIHLPSVELKIYLNEEIELNENKNDFKFGWFTFPGHILSSNYCTIYNSSLFKKSDHVVRWRELSNDVLLPKHITYQSKEVPLSGIIKGSNSIEIKDYMERIFNTIIIKEKD